MPHPIETRTPALRCPQIDSERGDDMAKMLIQAIDDERIKNAFLLDFNDQLKRRKDACIGPATPHQSFFTVDETSAIFLKHADKPSANAEISKQLFTMAPRADETLIDFGKRVRLEAMRAGLPDASPQFVSYLEGTLTPSTLNDMRLHMLYSKLNQSLDSMWEAIGRPRPDTVTMPTSSLDAWLRALETMEGKAGDTGPLPLRNVNLFQDGPKRPAQGQSSFWNKRPKFGQGTSKAITDTATLPRDREQPVRINGNKGQYGSSSASHADTGCTKCGMNNHRAPDCRTEQCKDCHKYHHRKRPCRFARKYYLPDSDSTSTAPKDSAAQVSTDAQLDALTSDYDDMGTADARINNDFYLYNAVLNLLNGTDNRITVPIVLKGQRYNALLDTGCTHTFIDSKLVQKLDIAVLPMSGRITLGKSGITATRKGVTLPMPVVCNSRQVYLTAEVMDLPAHDFHIGMDTLHQFGFGITGLSNPATSFEGDMMLIPDKKPLIIPETKVPEEELTTAFLSARDEAMATIEPALAANSSIPIDSCCPIPEMKVFLKVPDDTVVFRRQRPFAQYDQKLVDETVARWRSEGVVCLSPPGTPHNSPLTLAMKKDAKGIKSKQRVCLDPRLLNEHLPDDNFPLPLISDVLNKVAGHAIYSTLDLRQAYHRLPINESDRPLTTFTHDGKQYMFKRAPFGLKHISSLFQRGMSRILGDLPFVGNFIDDIIVFSNSFKEHALHLRIVINRLTQAKLILNPDKCHFFRTSVVLLGFVINSRGKQIDPTKLVNMHEWDYPTTSKQIQHYLGFFNFFREFIPVFSTLAAPLERLRNQTKPFQLDKLQRRSFDSFKRLLACAPILCFPNFSLPFYVATDASNVGIGAVLYQLPEGTEHPEKVAYISFMARSLQPSERKYSATKKEMLAIAFALSKFNHYLKGRKFTLYTDHRALTYLFTQKHTSIVMSGWQDVILEYDFDIVYRPGILNILPDHLSRLFPKELWPKEQQLDDLLATTSIVPTDAEPMHITSCYMHVLQEDNVSTRAEVPEEQRNTVMAEAHGPGHFGGQQMVKTIHANDQTWPRLINSCLDYVKRCHACQRYNISRKGYHPLKSIHAELPGDHIAIDLAGPFPASAQTDSKGVTKTYTYLLVVVDVCTRFVYLRALVDKSAITVAKELFTIFCDIGFPKILQSDNGTEFVNAVLTVLTEQMQVQHRLITPYHPRANGVAECNVKTSVEIIRKAIQGNPNQWAEQVPVVQLSMNTRVVDLHRSSPYSLFFARRYSGIGNFTDTESQLMNSDQLLERLDYMTKVVFPAASERAKVTQQKMVDKFNATVLHNIFADGAIVMALDPIRGNKLDAKYEGPYTVVKQDCNGAYTLRDATGTILERKYAASQLKLVLADALDPNAYTVGSILNHRNPNKDRPEHEYLVHWKGYDNPKDHTWEPYSHFFETRCIQDYWKARGKPIPHTIRPGDTAPTGIRTGSVLAATHNEIMCPEGFAPQQIGEQTAPTQRLPITKSAHTTDPVDRMTLQ